jgi:hypothetical protein
MFSLGALNYSKVNLGKQKTAALRQFTILIKKIDSTVKGYNYSIFLQVNRTIACRSLVLDR